MNITWTKNKAIVSVPYSVRQSTYVSILELDFDYIGLKRGGILEEVLDSLVLPIDRTSLSRFINWIKSIKDNVCLLILSTATAQLDQDDLKLLYLSGVQHTIDIKYKGRDRSSCFSLVRAMDNELSCGTPVSSVPFHTIIIPNATPSIRWLNHGASKRVGIINENEILGEIRNADSKNSEEIRDCILKAIRKKNKTIEDRCWEIVQSYQAVYKKHKNLLEAPIPQPLKGKTLGEVLCEVNSESKALDALSFLLHQVGSVKLYSCTSLTEGRKLKGLTELFSSKNLESILWHTTKLRKYWLIPWEKFNFTPVAIPLGHHLLSYWYLPTPVMTALETLFLLWTGWNSGVVLSITSKHVLMTPKYIKIDGVKTKNGQNFSTTVIRRNQPKFYEAIQILLRHESNAKLYWHYIGDKASLFATWSNDLGFKVQQHSTLRNHITKPLGIPAFSRKQLRDQAACELYLVTLDPFKVKEHLGHANIATTFIYLNQHVIRLMNEANVNRFMDKMSATITWATRGELEVEVRGMQPSDIEEKLLFPVSKDSDAPSLVDDWLTSNGEMQLEIGLAEIEHLRYQIKFYNENKERMQSDNPKAFLLYHVPRIIFAAALAERVRGSKFSYLLKNISF